ncbi:MAG: transposase [Pseudomonadales bacterium]|nr:transposase [Pseudomonadales bacterium]
MLFYGYSTGVFSSRKLEKSTFYSIDFRYICAKQQPDHDSINTCRKKFRLEINALLVKIRLIAKEEKYSLWPRSALMAQK